MNKTKYQRQVAPGDPKGWLEFICEACCLNRKNAIAKANEENGAKKPLTKYQSLNISTSTHAPAVHR